MPLPVALINQTPNEIGIVDLGIFVPPGSGTILDLTGLYLIEEVRDSSDLQEQTVVSGSIVISGSEGVISSAAAARFFTGSQIAEQNFTTEGVDLRSLRNIIIAEGDNIVVTSGEAPNQTLIFTINTAPNVVADALVGAGNVTVVSGANTITFSGTDSAASVPTFGPFAFQFVKNGTITDAWLSLSEGMIFSDETPAVIPWASELIGVTMTNNMDMVDVDIDLNVAVSGAGADDNLAFRWEVRECRVASNTDVATSGITFSPGDKLGVFVNTFMQNKPQDVVVTTYFRALSTAIPGEICEDFSGNF